MKDIHIYKIALIIIGIVVISTVFLFSARGFSDQGKYVEVKGLSEKIVKADRGIWSMTMDVKSNDVQDLYAQVDRNFATIKDFLVTAGFSEEEISIAPVSAYQDTYSEALYRYNAMVNIAVYTDKVDLLQSVSKEAAQLLQKGIVFSSNAISFEFTDLATIKPEMLAEAVANAREAANQFAADAGSRLGDIARANQGVFSIEDKDPGSPEYKKVRVVSTVRYLLK